LVRAQRIACISQATRADVERVLAVPAARLAVVPNGPNHPYRPFTAAEVASVLAGLSGAPAPGVPYLFHVGSNAWYKNRAGVIRIAGALVARGAVAGLRLVFAGQRLDGGLRALVGECGLAGRVDELGEVGNDQLNALYSGALGLLFPSLAEGFGWPIVEAQAAGCVVFLSARPPLTEVGGEAAVHLDPCDPPAAAAAIAASLERVAELRRLGLANAARFSTAAMLDGYERLYREVQP
ncbi:MAG: glycosyltransferase, partial [Planctomycetes bacterium]|nr:glycosyltransferase [Planctomycetota bacterium]